MAKISFHASHEQFKPSELLYLVQAAEQAGFDGVLSSDHFFPWNERQGESGFAWSWLGAAMQATNFTFGVVNAPGQRYHPAIIAQATATLAEMFPDRFWVAFGSGQALNEHITGTYWPSKEERNERLLECVDIIRALWAGEWVNHQGLVVVEDAKLFTRPKKAPLAIGAAITDKTAEWVASWADGLITISHPMDKLRSLVEAFQRSGGEGKKMILKVQLSYDTNEEKATEGAHKEWKTNIFESNMLGELRTPEQFQAAGQLVKKGQMHEFVRIASDADKFIDWIKEYIRMGFDEIVLHNVNTNQEEFIQFFGKEVLPELRKFKRDSFVDSGISSPS
jgi:coenzyme F420-dependent glucose-6-phosphate dehydrogenase